MPDMSGLEALRRIRENAPKAAVMITGNADEEGAKACLKSGAYDFILKPFDLDYLETSLSAKLLLMSD